MVFGQAFSTQIARIIASQDGSPLAAFIQKKLCLAHADVVSTCESARYLIKQNNSHSSIGNSTGLFIIVMLPGAMMISMLLYLKHAKND